MNSTTKHVHTKVKFVLGIVYVRMFNNRGSSGSVWHHTHVALFPVWLDDEGYVFKAILV